jgi:hypothetical protein
LTVSQPKRLACLAAALFAASLGAQSTLAGASHASVPCDGGTVGTARADTLVGTHAPDRIRGARGPDILVGLEGEDCLAGGARNDRIDSGAGEDRVTASRGRDRLNTADGDVDHVRCGRGADVVVADRIDSLRGCERVKRPHRPESGPEQPPEAPLVAPPAQSFPTPATTGVPAGWAPKQVRTADLRVTQPGAVISDVLLQNADITVEAPNVTIHRVKLQGGVINNAPGDTCGGGLVIEQSTIEPAPGQSTSDDTEGVISYGGYTASGVEIWHRSEGFRASSCGPVTIRNSFALVTPPDPCGDWHGDGLQGYGAGPITVRNVTLELDIEGCGGTAPFFVPSGQGNTSADVDRLLVKGGGFPFRLGVPGRVTGLRIADGSWAFGPVDVRCAALTEWEAQIVEVSPEYEVTGHVRAQECEGTGT